MAKTKIEKSSLNKLKMSQKVTPTALDASNGMYIEYAHENLIIVVANTSESDAIKITVKAITGFEDFVLNIPKSETHVISNLESAYFKQPDGSLYLEASANSGIIFAIEDVI